MSSVARDEDVKLRDEFERLSNAAMVKFHEPHDAWVCVKWMVSILGEERFDRGDQLSKYGVGRMQSYDMINKDSKKTSYAKYINSEKWNTIRLQRLAIDSNECVLCGCEAKHVHHRRYPKTLGTETVCDLVSLCAGCHANYHKYKRAKEAK